MVADSFLSYKSLLGNRKPLDVWYVAFALNCANVWLFNLIIKATDKKIKGRCSCVLEGFQFVLWVCLCILVIIGWHWLISSFWTTPQLIPLRLKIEFSVYLLAYTLVLLPAVMISLFTILRVVVYANMIKTKSKMRNQLEE